MPLKSELVDTAINRKAKSDQATALFGLLFEVFESASHGALDYLLLPIWVPSFITLSPFSFVFPWQSSHYNIFLNRFLKVTQFMDFLPHIFIVFQNVMCSTVSLLIDHRCARKVCSLSKNR